MFETAKATFTSLGEAAARELVTALQEQQPERVLVVGHTDVRGGADYNLALSQSRADAVAAFLRENGIEVPVEAIGKGESEPLAVSDTAGLSLEDIYALNRRVEWRRE